MSEFDAAWRSRFERFGRTNTDEAEVSGWSATGLRRRLDLFSTIVPRLSLPPSARILEVGCGAGSYVRLLGGLGHRPVGLDYSLPSLARALASDPGAKGRYMAGDVYGLPFREGTFDMVMSIGVLQALSDPERAMDEMARVLSPGGILLVEALNAEGLPARWRAARDHLMRRPPRVRTYAPERIRRWIADRGLRLIEQPGVCLPPRRLPQVERLLDLQIVAAAREACPPLALAVTHAFWFVALRSIPARGDRR